MKSIEIKEKKIYLGYLLPHILIVTICVVLILIDQAMRTTFTGVINLISCFIMVISCIHLYNRIRNKDREKNGYLHIYLDRNLSNSNTFTYKTGYIDGNSSFTNVKKVDADNNYLLLKTHYKDFNHDFETSVKIRCENPQVWAERLTKEFNQRNLLTKKNRYELAGTVWWLHWRNSIRTVKEKLIRFFKLKLKMIWFSITTLKRRY